ncbi:hypothetical protein BH09SUM1_BH09SUM1_15350 [soil metagenome]
MSFLLTKKKTRKTVLFLCTGDTCRGPMAQGYMKRAMDEREVKGTEVRTAGVMTIPGLIPTQEAAQVMENAGIDVSMHRSSPLTKELIRKADLILGMTPFHVQFALRMSEDAKDKTHLLKEFAESDLKNYQITDPMGATLEVYKRVYREMKLAIDKMLDKSFFAEVVEKEEKRVVRRAGTGMASPPISTAHAAPAAAKKPATPPPAPAKPAAKATAPAPKVVAKPAAKPVAKEAAKAPAKPAAKPAVKPAAKPVAKAPVKPAAKKPAPPAKAKPETKNKKVGSK